MFLNSSFLRNRVAQLGFKQWWLAEQIGVDRKTVIRWLQGKTRSIQSANAEALAKILECKVGDFCTTEDGISLSTPDDQKAAAQLLVSSSLIDRLGPLGEWNVVESLIKATIVPDLPLHVLGELYNQLTVASWRQSKLEQAELYNQKALELANRSGDTKIRAEALLSSANLHSWRGRTGAAIATYEECLRHREFLNQKTVGAVHSNLGAVLFEAGNLEAGLRHQQHAKDCFLIHGRPMNFSILYCNKAMIYLQQEKILEAEAACEKSLSFARSDDYKRGIQMSALLRAEILVRNGRSAEAAIEAEQALAGFSALGIQEGLNYEFAGRIFRFAGRLLESERFLRQGIELAEEYPVYRAALFFELAKTLDSREAAKKAQAIYNECGCPLRVAAIEKHVFSKD